MTSLKTVVVTGSTGFIGSALVRRLSADGARVVCPVRASSARREQNANVPGVEIHALESFSADSLARAFGDLRADAVFHLAAYGVGAGERDPIAMLEGNATLTAHVMIAAQHWAPKRIVFAGTCSEYAPAPEGYAIKETHPLWPTTLYGAAKVAAEAYAATLALQADIALVSFRIFGTYGVGEAPFRLIPHVIERLARGEEPELTPGGHVRDLSYVDDVVEALVLAATHREIHAGAYNVCSGIGHRVADVARRVAELMGRPDAPLGLGRRPYRSDEPMWLVGDPTRFRDATGWTPRVTLDDGIRKMVEASRARS